MEKGVWHGRNLVKMIFFCALVLRAQRDWLSVGVFHGSTCIWKRLRLHHKSCIKEHWMPIKWKSSLITRWNTKHVLHQNSLELLSWNKTFSRELNNRKMNFSAVYYQSLSISRYLNGFIIERILAPAIFFPSDYAVFFSYHNGNGNGNVTKQKVSWAEQWLCTWVTILGTFLCLPLQMTKFCVVWRTWTTKNNF